MNKMIPYGRQDIGEDDIEAVVEVLRSDLITQGPVINRFEEEVAQFCGATYAVAVSSATSALHLACLALRVGRGDIVWTTPITFVASANCALYCGASIDFVDIDPCTYNIDVAKLEEKLKAAEAAKALPKAVVAVHLCGQACNMEVIGALRLRYGFKVIEDASHAIGGLYQGKRIGDGRFSDITIFSFHPVKIITTGEGGMALTNDKELFRRMALLRSHGITRDAAEMTNLPDGPWYYEQLELGYNYRMTDLQAALGLSQLKKLGHFVECRKVIAAWYNEAFRDFPVITPWQHPDTASAWHLYVIRLRLQEIRSTHREVFQNLRAEGIGVNLHYIPVYHHPYYARLGLPPKYCIQAESYYAEAISLPIFPALTESDLVRVKNALHVSLT